MKVRTKKAFFKADYLHGCCWMIFRDIGFLTPTRELMKHTPTTLNLLFNWRRTRPRWWITGAMLWMLLFMFWLFMVLFVLTHGKIWSNTLAKTEINCWIIHTRCRSVLCKHISTMSQHKRLQTQKLIDRYMDYDITLHISTNGCNLVTLMAISNNPEGYLNTTRSHCVQLYLPAFFSQEEELSLTASICDCKASSSSHEYTLWHAVANWF